MKVELAKLKMSHVRDFKVDPQEHEQAEPLIASIKESGFWGGVVINKGHNGDLEVVAGHKRVWAAMQAGVTHADLHVGKYDDRQAIRVYASENITQRGATAGLAMAGAVASAIRYIAKAILKGDKDSVSGIQLTEKPGKNDIEHLQGYLMSADKGVGYGLILNFYKGIDAINQNLVKEHLANLKSSGDYSRIIKEVTEEVANEHAIELAELERKEKEAEERQQAEEAAKAKAKKEKAVAKHAKAKETGAKATEAAAKPVTFDLAGVGKHLKNENQLRAFRETAKKPDIQKYLPVGKQAELAAALVAHAKKINVELTGKFIQENMLGMMHEAARAEGKLEDQAQKEMEEADVRIKWHNLSHHFARNVLGVEKDGEAMLKLMTKHRDIQLGSTKEVRKAVFKAEEIINQLAEEFRKQIKQ